MNIIFKYIKMRNFYSFGNVAQNVELDSSPLTLVLGQNNDAATSDGPSGHRNGVGKTALIQAINFGLFGKSVGNKVKVANLINKTNKKNCEVTIGFEKDGVPYRIERFRSPTSLSFYVDDVDSADLETDDARGECKDTQKQIENLIGFSQEMFNQIVTLSTSVEPFLGLGPAKQRELIEQLLGITQLSEKATVLKELIKDTKSGVTNEEFKLDTLTKSNEKVQSSITQLEEQSNMWEENTTTSINQCIENLNLLSAVDIAAEIASQNEAQLATLHNDKFKIILSQIKSVKGDIATWEQDHLLSLKNLQIKFEDLDEVDIEYELTQHDALRTWEHEYNDIQHAIKEYKRLDTDHKRLVRELSRHETQLQKYQTQLETTKSAKCHTCGQPLADDDHTNIVAELETKIADVEGNIVETNTAISLSDVNKSEHDNNNIYDQSEQPKPHYKDINEAYNHQNKLARLRDKITEEDESQCPYNKQLEVLLEEQQNFEMYDAPTTIYETIDEAYEHKNMTQALTSELETLQAQTNPYADQVITLQKDSLQVVDYNEINRLRKLLDHQDFLVKLLTNKDSFVRKRIIEQNISFLNQRLTHYIDKCGSPHQVEFINDLSVEITKMGDSLDYENLSRGEKCRVIISLALAFRDTFESLYGSYNLLLIDEMMDSGLDQSGLEACYSIIKEMGRTRNKNTYIISHREELIARSEHTMTVVKENGFTTIEYDQE